ncbi:MAG: glycogen-binding domain-containing protein [Gemmataceae bacterium]|nr:glycogen-binding domain-containing protein [Gemmataceae bacterium]
MTKKHEPKQAHSTRFACHAPAVQAVFLAGTFNGWKPDATPMAKDGEGEWSVSLKLPPGRYEYKFVVDGHWCCEPGCDDRTYQGSGCVVNEYGTQNRVIEVT